MGSRKGTRSAAVKKAWITRRKRGGKGVSLGQHFMARRAGLAPVVRRSLARDIKRNRAQMRAQGYHLRGYGSGAGIGFTNKREYVKWRKAGW